MLDPGSLFEENESGDELQRSLREIPTETLWAFVIALLFAHVGLFAASLGLMLVGFRGRWMVGGVLFGGGMLALVVTVGVVWWHEHRAEQ